MSVPTNQIFTRERYAKSNSYRSLDRWCSYWHQIDFVRDLKPEKVLEVGIGQGVTTDYLRGSGYTVTTLDIDESLAPDIVGNVCEIPLPDNAVDVSLAAEILEHLPLEDARKALKELYRISRVGAVISAPTPGYIFSLKFKIPFIKWAGITKIPFFWKTYTFDASAPAVHYWELGYKNLPVTMFEQLIRDAGFTIKKKGTYQDDPSHLFFQLVK